MAQQPEPGSSTIDLERAVIAFVEAFEVVFHYDWSWTATNLGCFRNSQPDSPSDFTFLEPGLSLSEEREDWHSRGALLAKYRELVLILKARGASPQVPDPPQPDWQCDRADWPRPWR